MLLRHLEKTNPEALALARDWDDTAWTLVKTRKRIARSVIPTLIASSLTLDDLSDCNPQNLISLGQQWHTYTTVSLSSVLSNRPINIASRGTTHICNYFGILPALADEPKVRTTARTPYHPPNHATTLDFEAVRVNFRRPWFHTVGFRTRV